MDLGTQLKVARAKARISQSTLGKVLGVSTVTVNLYEMGHVQPSPARLTRIKAFLELDPRAVSLLARQRGWVRRSVRKRKGKKNGH